MNNPRRKKLKEIMWYLNALREDLETLMDEEQEYFDTMPEGIQLSGRGEKATMAISNMENAMLSIGDACSYIKEATA